MKGSRRYKRFSVDVMNIKGRMTVSSRVDVLDINAGRIKLKTDLRLNVDTEYVLHLQTEERSLKLKGLVEWSSISEPVRGLDDEIIPMYTAEMTFSPDSGGNLSELHYFTEIFHTDEEERLSGLVLQISEQENALIDQHREYKVKKVSLGGMLIGSAGAFEVDCVFPMELTLPGGKIINFKGRITSCNPAHNSMLPNEMGIAFTEMPDQGREILDKFLRSLEKEDEDWVDVWSRYKHL
jgi:hypothetical protein